MIGIAQARTSRRLWILPLTSKWRHAKNKSMNTPTSSEALPLTNCSPRFILEERSGIVAIYDTHHPDYEQTPGCHADYPWVVCHWNGSPVYSDAGGIAYWEVEPRWITKARQTRDLLNSLENVRCAGNQRAGEKSESTTELRQPAGLPAMTC